MIAADTSSLSAFFAGDPGLDVEMVTEALADGQLLLPPVVLTELLSSTRLRGAQATALAGLPVLSVADGYWERAGRLRASVLRRRLKSRLADVLIAQSCIDHSIALITRDHDFRHYLSAGLKLFP